MQECNGRLCGVLEYNTDLYEGETIGRMIRHYKELLESVARDTKIPIGEMKILGLEEEKRIVEDWNRTEAEYPKDKCVHELFEEQVRKSPQAVAVVYEETSLTYEELNTRANQLAHYLRKRGVGPEVIVGICVERSLEMMVGLLGILKAGGAYLPLDPEYPKERLRFMVEDAQVKVLLTQKRLKGVIEGYEGEEVYLDEDWERVGKESKEDPQNRTKANNLVYVIYTSGSTGKPKGVQLEHSKLNLVR